MIFKRSTQCVSALRSCSQEGKGLHLESGHSLAMTCHPVASDPSFHGNKGAKTPDVARLQEESMYLSWDWGFLSLAMLMLGTECLYSM